MLPEKVLNWGKNRSCIRELMEYGAKRKAEIGAENVFDFSIGNPSVPAPAKINETIVKLATQGDVSLHAYTTAAGLLSFRQKISSDLKERFDLNCQSEHIYVTCGAAAALTITLNALINHGDEVIVFAPFFPEYRVFIEAAGGIVKIVKPDQNFKIDFQDLEDKLSAHTKAVIINTPNNPSGVMYDDQDLKRLSSILNDADTQPFIISDEPYRELVYDDKIFVSPLVHYAKAIMCYSFSKSMSLAGERLGYIALNENMPEIDEVYAAILGAGRSLGFVNAPTLFQHVIMANLTCFSDIKSYQENRQLLTEMLKDLGYSYIEPEGAFYLFVKALEADAKAFSERAKKYELLLVPSDDFGVTGYVRIAYCVDANTIRSADPAFKALMEEYKNER